MADGTHGTGPNNGGSASDNASGSGAVNPADIERMINDAVSKALGARMKRLNLEETIAKSVESHLEKIASNAQSVGPVDTDGGNLNLKTLDAQMKAQFKALQEKYEASERARAEAEQRASQSRLTADLNSTFARYMGADNKHLPAYLKMYQDQFRIHEGQTYRATKNQFGEEELVPLDAAAEAMFKDELKHVLPQKTTNLPSSSIARGTPMASANSEQPRVGIFEREILHQQAMHDFDKHAELYGKK